MNITDIDFTLLEDGDVLITITLSVPQTDKSESPFAVKVSKELEYQSWATACLVIALERSGDDTEDSDDNGTRH